VIASDDGHDEGQSLLLHEFDDFEDVILLAKRLNGSPVSFGKNSLYVFKKKYYVKADTDPAFYDDAEAVFSEYGAASGLSGAYLEEYGDLMIKDEAMDQLQKYF
jgi:adapter protein MecA 1/2